MGILSFFKSLFRNKKSFQKNDDDFDWDAYEKACDRSNQIYLHRKVS